jgi:Helix-turn-helix domain of resolvase
MPRHVDDEQLRALLAQGIPQREICRRTGIPRSTLYDRLKRLSAIVPVQRSVQTFDTGAVSSADTGAVQRMDRLEDEVQGLRHLVQALMDRFDHPPVSTPVQITTPPPYPKGKAVRWNLWILDRIRDELATLAAERGISPSQLVQEILWQALSDRR